MSRSTYLTGVGSTRWTPQSEPIPGSTQVPNSAGGHAWEVGPLDRLRRFLVLGSAGGSYYASEHKLTKENAAAVRVALDELGPEAVAEVVAVSEAGRAPKNDEAIYALAMGAGHDRDDVRNAALEALPRVCRTGTHLFTFCTYVEQFRGWGRALKKAVAGWYLDKEPQALAYQLVKYRQRNGWTHRDVLRLCKPGSESRKVSSDHDALFRFSTKGSLDAITEGTAQRSIWAYARAQDAPSAKQTAELVALYGSDLPWEALKTEHLADPKVIEALAPTMPLGALVRQLGRFSAHDALKPMASLTTTVAQRLANEDEIRRSRLHPIALLSALIVYSQGHGARGTLTWEPTHEIVDALDSAFYTSFGNVEKTGKRQLLALDVSSSMSYGEIASVPGLTPRVASAALALVQANVGDPYHAVAFSHQMVPLSISPRERLDDVLRKVDALPYGATDCALPMAYAAHNGLDVDGFVVFTDNETWFGRVHPAQALVAYRERHVSTARLGVVGMVSNGFSIASPDDPGMLDCVGMDTATPQLLSNFIAGRI